MRRRIRRWWARHRPRMRTLTRAEAADMLLRAADGLATCGTLTIDDDLPTETRRPTMDLDALIARWRRMSGHLRGLRSGAGGLTPADAYELCADELEARVRTHELMQQARKESDSPTRTGSPSSSASSRPRPRRPSTARPPSSA